MTRPRVAPLAAALALAATGALADDWAMAIEPYVWAPGIDLGLGIGANPPVDSSTAIFDVLDGAALFAAEARRGPLSVFGEFNWLNLSDTIEMPLGILDTSWRVQGVMASVNLGYALLDGEGGRVEPFVGLRGWTLDARTRVLGRTAEQSRGWIDPLLGLRAEVPLGERTLLRGMSNFGGFGVGADLQWEALAVLEWRSTDRIGLSLGYRHLVVDFGEDGLIWDTTLSGPLVSVRIFF